MGKPINRRSLAVFDACGFTIKFTHFLVKTHENINGRTSAPLNRALFGFLYAPRTMDLWLMTAVPMYHKEL